MEHPGHGHVIPQASPRARNSSTAFLDGLRGLAALFVLIQHYIGSFDANVHEHGFGEGGNYYFASLPFIRIVFSGGNSAVAIFFVLSGYVLSKSPLGLIRNEKRHACGLSLLSSVIRRPVRLYMPPLGVALAYAILMHAPFGIVPATPWPQPKESVFAEIISWFVESVKYFNPFQIHGFVNRAWYPYMIIAWTIPIELKGSMLVYALTAIYAFSRLPRLVSLLLLAITFFVLLQLGEWTMACFIAGHILAYVDVYSLDGTYLTRRFKQRGQAIIWNVMFFTGYYLLCQPAHSSRPEYSLNTPGWYYLTILTPKTYDKDHYYRYWHSWGALLVVYSALRLQWLQRFLDRRPLRYLGKVSFMLYLVHLPMGTILGNRVARMLGQVSADAEYSWWNNKLYIPDVGPAGMSSRFLVALGIMLPVCLVISDFGTRALDMPSVRVGKIMAQRLGLDKSVPSRVDVDNEGRARSSEYPMNQLLPG